MNVECYRNRFGGFGIVPTDSTMIGEAVDLACCRTEKQAEELVRKLNSHDALLAACQFTVEQLEREPGPWDTTIHKLAAAIALATGNKIATPAVSENLNQPLR